MSKSTRDIRQAQCIKNWIANKGKGTIVASTGFGKTRVGTNIIGLLVKKFPNVRVLIVVPTLLLKEQWTSIIDELGYTFNCDIQVINTVVTREWKCDLLIIDEIHSVLAETFAQVFEKVEYKKVLGLTATFERLDGRHEICNKYCPICDSVPITECLMNGWVSPYKEYQVIIDVDNIEEYKQLNKEFQEHFGYFNFEWDLVNKCLGPNGFKARYALSKEWVPNDEEKRKATFKMITFHATSFMRVLQKRKAFINNHPKKIEITRRIIDSRPFSKIITFSNSIKMAESVGIGQVYSGKDSKKKGRTTLEEFSKVNVGVLNTIRKADAGLDLPGLSVGIIIGTDSSGIKAKQRLGRVVRKENDKKAEVFYIIINETVELSWFKKSHESQPYITIDEAGLDAVLRGEEPPKYQHAIKNFQYRF